MYVVIWEIYILGFKLGLKITWLGPALYPCFSAPTQIVGLYIGDVYSVIPPSSFRLCTCYFAHVIFQRKDVKKCVLFMIVADLQDMP